MELLESLIDAAPDMFCSIIIAWLAYAEITRRRNNEGDEHDD